MPKSIHHWWIIDVKWFNALKRNFLGLLFLRLLMDARRLRIPRIRLNRLHRIGTIAKGVPVFQCFKRYVVIHLRVGDWPLSLGKSTSLNRLPPTVFTIHWTRNWFNEDFVVLIKPFASVRRGLRNLAQGSNFYSPAYLLFFFFLLLYIVFSSL